MPNRLELIASTLSNSEFTRLIERSSQPTHRELSKIRSIVSGTPLPATIPLQKDVQFGYRYKIIGQPDGAQVDIKPVTNYPPPGLRSPTSQQPVLRAERIRKRLIGETSVTTYTLEDDFELVPGVWTFEIYDGSCKLVSKTFTLVNRQ
jgi:Domain of unknown function (DUF3859)